MRSENRWCLFPMCFTFHITCQCTFTHTWNVKHFTTNWAFSWKCIFSHLTWPAFKAIIFLPSVNKCNFIYIFSWTFLFFQLNIINICRWKRYVVGHNLVIFFHNPGDSRSFQEGGNPTNARSLSNRNDPVQPNIINISRKGPINFL